MWKLHFLWLAWGPLMLSVSLAWLVRHPHDWTGPAVVAPLALLYGIGSYGYALRRMRRSPEEPQWSMVAAMILAPVIGAGVALRIILGD